MNNIDIDDIKQLLDRYYDGSSNYADEHRLRAYFSGYDVADELATDKDIFLSLSDKSRGEVPEDLGDRISAEIDNWNEREKLKRRFTFRTLISIAASLAVAVTIGVWFMQQPVSTRQQLSPEEAYAQTEKALIIFAKAIDKSVNGIENFDRTTNKIDMQINSHLKQLNEI